VAAGIEHIFLHLSLCNAIAKLPAETVVPMHVQLLFRTGDPPFDKVFRVTRGDGAQTVLEFDVTRNLYKLHIDVPKYACSATDFLDVLTDSNRTVTEKLVDGSPPPDAPVTLLVGTAPMSFTYVKPTFSIFDKALTCNQPIPSALPSKINVEYDQGGYYVWLYPDATLDAHAPVVVALRLRTPTGTAHYVHLPIVFPAPWAGWPNTVQFDISEEMLDGIATEKTDTLLCPKLWGTSVH
jgi:hypothetical protein